MRAVVQMNHAVAIIGHYDGSRPLSEHLKNYFRDNRQIGSKDRQYLRALVYGAFRLGAWRLELDQKSAITLGYFLTNDKPDPFLEYWLPQFSQLNPAMASQSIDDKWRAISQEWDVKLWDVFPLWEELSGKIDKEAYVKQLFQQLPVYAYPLNLGFREVLAALGQQAIPYTEKNGTFQFPPETRLQTLPGKVQQHLVVQDWNSQRLVDELPLADYAPWWDCCAGAGGKSLRMEANEPGLSIWATDYRRSILKNLKQRLKNTGVALEHVQEIDLTRPLPDSWPTFNGILMDAPCTGSGTWARTPERITQVDRHAIQEYQQKQVRLIQQAIKALKPGGIFVYVTCSVFEQENEAPVKFLAQEGYAVDTVNYYPGYEWEAESFFQAVIAKASTEAAHH